MSTTTGDRLRALRQELGLSQDEVAKKIGISRPAYVNYEQGKSRPVRKLKELAAFFDVTSDYIMGLSNDPHGTMVPEGKGFCEQYIFDPPPEFYSDPETRELMEKMKNDPHHRRILLASKDLKPDELDRIADLMETIINARKLKEESL